MSKKYTYQVDKGVIQIASHKIKKTVAGFAVALSIAGIAAVPTFALTPNDNGQGAPGVASPNAQCDTAAGSAAYADQNGNFGYLGARGGADGYQTGLNNSAVCGHRP